MNGDFVTFGIIGTYAGAVTATAIITQFLKGIPFMNKCNSQLVSFVVAVILLEAKALFENGWNFETAVLSVVNGVFVALAANGTYDAINTKKTLPAIEEKTVTETKEG